MLAHIAEPFMLRREGSALVAYLDFEAWVRADTTATEDTLSKLFTTSRHTGLSFSGWVGFWTYDFLAAHMGLGLQAKLDMALPAALFGRPRALLRIFKNHAEIETADASRLKALRELSQRPAKVLPQKPQAQFTCNLNFSAYRDIFYAAREHILDGDTYQIKISQRYEARCQLDALSAFRRLDALNPSPEAFIVHTPECKLVSCSPETVIDKQGAWIETRPIGGTWERKATVDERAHLASFTSNDKELSEHHMLVDLERNDLARICRVGSVEVARFRQIEPYAHLYHLVSTIRGELAEGVQGADIVRALLPGGSITGCPKWRTMELIDEFEPCARGIYTGSFGTISDAGDMRFNLMIRTLLGIGDSVYAQAGGGIVVDSTPEYEYHENAIKARALLEVLQ